ncbi:hypothetical protein OG876_00420 [Kribbella sp. NBC_00359]
MVEIFFSIITRQSIGHGTFTSVRDLIDAIRAFHQRLERPLEPLVWTKTADQLLGDARPGQRTSFTRRWMLQTCHSLWEYYRPA